MVIRLPAGPDVCLETLNNGIQMALGVTLPRPQSLRLLNVLTLL
jgi:hypothetical protein